MNDVVLKPDFNSYVVDSTFNFPNSELDKVSAVFDDEMLSGYKAVVLADSITPDSTFDSALEDFDDNTRLTTFVVRFPRCILSEINTHRKFSRNSASSRARSMKTTITELMEDPYIPLFTKNERGMSGRYLTASERKKAVKEWLEGRNESVVRALKLLLVGHELADTLDVSTIEENYSDILDTYQKLYQEENEDILSPHKQNVNRILEPYMWHEAIISATHWENYFKLRIDEDNAQPEIIAIATLMKEALKVSVPVKTWLHLPFEDNKSDELYADNNSVPITISDYKTEMMSSAGDCARVSYKSKIDSGATDSSKLGERLLEAGHMSPFEHVAVPQKAVKCNDDKFVDNFSDQWIQFRTLIQNEWV